MPAAEAQSPPDATSPVSEPPAAPAPPAADASADAQPPEATQQAPAAGEEEVPSAGQAPEQPPCVIIRYGLMRHLGLFRHNLDATPPPGTRAVVRTERGVELGQIILSVTAEARRGCITHAGLEEFLRANGSDYPFRRDGRVLRLANAQDVIDHRHLESSAVEEGNFCRQQIKELKLPMKLVTVEHLLGGERIIFYFSAEQRVDFRELVRRLAAQFRTRIEMRQVGARDEARLVADYERCGMQCCCQQFLKDLKPVSMRMAKTQKATLDPSKISGRCGRLMCCLRYEDAGYEDLRQKLPKRNIWVRTADCVGRVVETQILTQLVRLALIDGTYVTVGNEEIAERDVEAPPPPQAAPDRRAELAAKRARERAQPRLLRDELGVQATPEAQTPGPQPPPAPPDAAAASPAAPQADQPPAQQEAPVPAGAPPEASQAQPIRKRRRRRRSGRPPGAGGGAQPPRTSDRPPADAQPAPAKSAQAPAASPGAPRTEGPAPHGGQGGAQKRHHKKGRRHRGKPPPRS